MVINVILLIIQHDKREITRTCTAHLFASAALATRRKTANVSEQNLFAAEANDKGIMPTRKKYG